MYTRDKSSKSQGEVEVYYIIPLTKDEVASGALFGIQDTLTGASDASMKKIREGARNLVSKDILVYATNAQDNPGFYSEWGDEIMDVMYANELAYQLLASKNIVKSELTSKDLPDGKIITFLKVPYYS